ncbi:chaperone protein dnaJ 8, chloroplastic-like [Canna indica]|uniref:Chaperone protein dnaJ 8, chloroplastic-like n=1 Tax=Canna indica TaxID=4628 RepID=A0AAQ3KZ39_9LILI|nr:chaperone protein dnaJ 8, chloroplastic-like [Canna indica]
MATISGTVRPRWRCGVLRGRRRSDGEVRCSSVAGGGLVNNYRTLRIHPGASESEVKKAFRKLALQVPPRLFPLCFLTSFFLELNGLIILLQFHPDVCKGSNCGVQFHRINEAYDTVMRSLRLQAEKEEQEAEQQWQPPEWSDAGDKGMGSKLVVQ